MSILVVKLGGNAIDDPETICADLARLRRDRQVVVVHGGGPQASRMQERLGLETRRVGGRRITDAQTLDVMKMVVGGQLNINLCAALLRAGAKPVGLHGASACAIAAERRPPQVIRGGPDEPVDLGLVGDVTGLNHALIGRLLEGGYLPVLACLGASDRGEVFNINADVVAGRVAVELKAEALVLVSDIVGVLRDRDDPASRIPVIRRGDLEALVDDGVVTEGMVAKVVEAFEAIDAGVGRVHVVGGLTGGQLAREMDEPGAVGTAMMR